MVVIAVSQSRLSSGCCARLACNHQDGEIMSSKVITRANVVAQALRVCSAIIAVLGVIGSALIPFDTASTIGGGGFPEFLVLLLFLAVAVLLLLTCASVLELLSIGHRELVPEGMHLRPTNQTPPNSAASQRTSPTSYACPSCSATVQLSKSSQSAANADAWLCPECSSAHTWKIWVKNKVESPLEQVANYICPKCGDSVFQDESTSTFAQRSLGRWECPSCKRTTDRTVWKQSRTK
jgi:DNA-directed RNA polymerase subunit RPC12/RpoP